MKKKSLIMLGWLCFWIHSIVLGGIKGKELCYNVQNNQDRPLFVHCKVYHSTGEKGPFFEQIVSPGMGHQLIRQNLKENCREAVVVVCKLKKAKNEITMERFLVTIPCETITAEGVLKLEILKNNTLIAHYP